MITKKFLGKGTYARVYKKDISPFGIVAVKKYKKNEGIAPDMIREISVLKKLHQQNINIITLISVQDRSIYLEYCEYDLETYMKRNILTISHINNFLNDICKGIYYLHCHGLIHADLKPSNLVVNHEYNLKIIDLGFTKTTYLYNDPNNDHIIVSTPYRAPEIVLLRKYSFPIDVWSIGCILAEMLSESVLFPFRNNKDLTLEQFKLLGITSCYKGFYPPDSFPLYPVNILYKFPKLKSKTLYKILIGFLHPDPLLRLTLCDYFIIRNYKDCFLIKDNKLTYIDNNFSNKVAYIQTIKDNKLTYIQTTENTETTEIKIITEYKDTKDIYLKNLYNYEHVKITFGNEMANIRHSLLLWLLEFNDNIYISDNVYFRTVILFDMYLNFLYTKYLKIKTSRLNIILLCCYWIASKCDSYSKLKLASLLKYSDYKYFSYEFINTEVHICNSLDYDFVFPVFSDYISLYSDKFNLNGTQKETYTKYMRHCTLYPEFYDYNFSLLALLCAYKCLHSDLNNVLQSLEVKKLQSLDLPILQKTESYLNSVIASYNSSYKF